MPHLVLEVFLWLGGLCVGSFINVVVYRLGVGLTPTEPRRSFCPRCQASIAWYDNIPLLSWAWLRGRCRHCRGPISVRYPLIEAVTGLAFVLVYHLIFVAQARRGPQPTALPSDWTLLFAWLVLAAGLVTCAGLDIRSYTIDIRVTNFVIVVGVLLRAASPAEAPLLAAARHATAAAAIAALMVGAATLWLRARRTLTVPEPHPSEEPSAGSEDEPEPQLTRVGGAAAVVLIVVLVAWLVSLPLWPASAAPGGRDLPVAFALAALFAVTALAGGQERAADEEIRAAIEDERPLARRMALRELAALLPAAAAAVVAYELVREMPVCWRAWESLVSWTAGGPFVPVAGAVVAMRDALLVAAVGWVMRILFTLIYGREAFGVGDIYILAAAGATVGWDIALLGLVLSVGIALAGWTVGLLLKTTVLIPFGPWLALGFLLALWWDRPAGRMIERYLRGIAAAWEEQPHVLLVAGGLMLIASAAAIALSRLVRRWVAPDDVP